MLKKSITGLLLSGSILAANAGSASAIEVSQQLANASLAGAPNSSAYLVIKNTANTDATLTSIETQVAKRAEIHDMAIIDGVMKMKALPKLVIPAKQSVALQAGGMHLMLLNLKSPLKHGQSFDAVLKFSDGSDLTVKFPVKARK